MKILKFLFSRIILYVGHLLAYAAIYAACIYFISTTLPLFSVTTNQLNERAFIVLAAKDKSEIITKRLMHNNRCELNHTYTLELLHQHDGTIRISNKTYRYSIDGGKGNEVISLTLNRGEQYVYRFEDECISPIASKLSAGWTSILSLIFSIISVSALSIFIRKRYFRQPQLTQHA